MTFRLKIGGRLALGFALIFSLMTVTVGFSIYEGLRAEVQADNLRDFRVPSAFASQRLMTQTIASANALHGFMLTKAPEIKGQWEEQWRKIDATVIEIDQYAAHYTTQASRDEWQSLRSMLPELKNAQAATIALAEGPEFGPPIRSLHQDVLPLFNKIQMLLNGDGSDIGLAGRNKALLFRDLAGAVDQIDRANIGGLVGLAILLLVGAVVAVVTTRSIVEPLRRINDVLKEMAAGNYEIDVPGTASGDETGELARAALIFRDNGRANVALRTEQAAAEKRAEAAKRQFMSQMADEFDTAVGSIVKNVASASTELRKTAQVLTNASEETSNQSGVVASASEEASTNVDHVAAATEELSSSVNEISRQVTDAANIAKTAALSAESTSIKVERLSLAATKIGDIVGLITNIASQTNLLALNATIEAARAGESGRGFAIVAAEVKGLADQTARATHEISEQIAEIQASTRDSATAIGEISIIVQRLSGISSDIAQSVEQQGLATREIARNVQMASEGTREVSANIGGVTRAAEESNIASAQVLGSAKALSQESEKLKLAVDTFLTKVRAG